MLALKCQLKRRVTFLILMAVGSVVLTAAPAMGWGSIVSVASDVPSWYPQLAVDGETVHLVYRDGYGAGTLRIKYQRSLDGGAAWGSVTTLSGVDEDKDAVIVCDGDTVLVIWTDGTTSTKLRAVRSLDGGSSWGASYDLLSQASWLRFPQVVVDSKHNFHMIYSHANNIYYRMSRTGNSGSWSSDSVVMSTYLYRPGLSIDGNDVIYASARNNWPDQISLARLSTLGGSWSSEINVANTLDNDDYVSFPKTASSLGGETLYIVFENGTKRSNTSSDSGNPIFFSYSLNNGTTWADSVLIGVGFCPQIRVDGQDSINLVWYQNNGTTDYYGAPQGNIIYRSAPGPTHVFGDTARLNLNPALTVATVIPDVDPPKGFPNLIYYDSALYAAWTDASTDNNRVFFRRHSVGGAGVTKADSISIVRQDRYILPADGASTTAVTISVGIGAVGVAGETISVRLLQGGGSLSASNIVSSSGGTATLLYTVGAVDDTTAIILFSDTCNGAALYETAYVSIGMIEDFENGLAMNGAFLTFGTGNEGITLDSLVKHGGNYSLGDTADFSGGTGWGIGWQKVFSDSVDISDFLTVSFWLRADAAVDTALVKLEFITGETPSTWSMKTYVPLTTAFTEVKRLLNSGQFQRTLGTGSFDTTYVTAFSVIFERGNMQYARSLYVDDITLSAQGLPSTLNVSLSGGDTSVDFDTTYGTMEPMAASDTIIITFSTLGIPDGTPWRIRIWSNHPAVSDGDAAKLVGAADSQYAAELKVWCNNLGPAGNCPPTPFLGSTFDTGYFYFPDYGDTIATPDWGDWTRTLINDSIIYDVTTIYAGLASQIHPGLPAQKYETYLVIDLVTQ